MNCPKCKLTLSDSFLNETLPNKHCNQCQGDWIPGNEYEIWNSGKNNIIPTEPEQLSKYFNMEFVPSEFDKKGSLCPECKRYLSRAKVSIKNDFYVEKCINCGGIWCDEGEWNILTKLGLTKVIDNIFSSDWQAKVLKSQHFDKEKEATINKLGTELAEKVFKLAELLEKHPNGDFGVAYLMRRFDK